MATYVTGANTKFEEKQIWIARTYTRPLQEAVEGRNLFPLKFRENRGSIMSSGYTLKHVYRNFGVYDGDFRLKQVKKHYIFNIFIQLLRQSFSKITNF